MDDVKKGEKRRRADRRFSVDIGREVAIKQVIRALTVKRVTNALVNLLSLLFSVLSKKAIVWGMPPIVNVEPTNVCNLHCPLCTTGSGQMDRPSGFMDYSVYKRFIDAVADRAVYVTLYHQGEPYLHKEFNRFVAYAKHKRLYVNTSTNAHFFDKDLAAEVVKSRLDSMIISLDGVTQESYAFYRRGGSLEKVRQGIGNLVDAKKALKSKTPYLFLQFLVMKHNEYEIPAMKDMARDLEIDRLLFKTIQVQTIDEAEEWLPGNEALRRYRFAENILEVKKGGRGVCPRLWLTTLIDWDGVVVPCCFDKNGKYVMGHIDESPEFKRIWKSDVYQRFRRRSLTQRNSIDICRNCNYGVAIFR